MCKGGSYAENNHTRGAGWGAAPGARRVKKPALITAGCVFSVVSAAHWVRYFRADEVIVSGSVVPVWWSLILGVAILALAVWMFMASRGSG